MASRLMTATAIRHLLLLEWESNIGIGTDWVPCTRPLLPLRCRPALRRRLLQHAYHTDSPQWGVVQHAHHILLSHDPRLSHEQRHELTQHVEAAGCHHVGYVPDHTLLVVGSPEGTQAAAAHSHVVGSLLLEPADKLAPEWQQVTAAIAAALNSSGNASDVPARRQQRVAAVLATLPVRRERGAGGEPLVPVQVVFPSLLLPLKHAGPAGGQGQAQPEEQQARRHRQQEEQRQRVQRVLRQQAAYDAGAAAVADWAAPLAQQFGARISRGAAHLALVLAPPEKLPALLEWLAERPAVQWVAPAPRMLLHNKKGSAISQGGVAASSSSNGNMDPSIHPVWAAGITGANQTVGCGDTGIGALGLGQAVG